MTLETERLILRPFRADDAEAMFYGWASDPEVTRYLTWNAHKSIDVTRSIIDMWLEQYKKPERLNFAITLKEDGTLIGGIDVCGYLGGVSGTPVIGAAISKKYWNNGYVTEALKALVSLLFSRGYTEIRADAMVENTGSNKVIKKCGGEYIGTDEELLPLKNKVVSINRYLIRRH